MIIYYKYYYIIRFIICVTATKNNGIISVSRRYIKALKYDDCQFPRNFQKQKNFRNGKKLYEKM